MPNSFSSKITNLIYTSFQKSIPPLHICNILLYSSKIQVGFFFLWLIKFLTSLQLYRITSIYEISFNKSSWLTVQSLSSSSCRATSTDIPDPLPPFFSIDHCLWQVFMGYIPYPHIAAECMFVLVVLLLPGHMLGLLSKYKY